MAESQSIIPYQSAVLTTLLGFFLLMWLITLDSLGCSEI